MPDLDESERGAGKGGVFNFSVPWCACGKPMVLNCHQTPSDSYFTNVSYLTAQWARHKYICTGNQETDQTSSVVRVNAKRIDIFSSILSLTLYTIEEPEDLRVKVTVHKDINCPEALDVDQCAKLEGRDWEAFLGTLSPLFKLDLMVYEKEELILRCFCPLAWRESKFVIEDPERLQLNTGGNAYMCSLDRVHQLRNAEKRVSQFVSIGECTWTRNNMIEQVAVSDSLKNPMLWFDASMNTM